MSTSIEANTTNNNISVESNNSNVVQITPEVTSNTILIQSDNSPDIALLQAVINNITVTDAVNNNVSILQSTTNISVSDGLAITSVIPDSFIAVEAAEAIAAGELVVINSGGLAELADNSDLTQIQGAYGLAQSSVIAGQNVSITLSGIITTTTILTLSSLLYVGSSGAFTQTEPITGYLKIVGKPLTTTRFLIGFHPSITLI